MGVLLSVERCCSLLEEVPVVIPHINSGTLKLV